MLDLWNGILPGQHPFAIWYLEEHMELIKNVVAKTNLELQCDLVFDCFCLVCPSEEKMPP